MSQQYQKQKKKWFEDGYKKATKDILKKIEPNDLPEGNARKIFVIVNLYDKVMDKEQFYHTKEDVENRLKYLNSSAFLGKEEVTFKEMILITKPEELKSEISK